MSADYPTAQEYHAQLVALALEAFDRDDWKASGNLMSRHAFEKAIRERMAQAAQVYAVLLDECTHAPLVEREACAKVAGTITHEAILECGCDCCDTGAKIAHAIRTREAT